MLPLKDQGHSRQMQGPHSISGSKQNQLTTAPVPPQQLFALPLLFVVPKQDCPGQGLSAGHEQKQNEQFPESQAAAVWGSAIAIPAPIANAVKSNPRALKKLPVFTF